MRCVTHTTFGHFTPTHNHRPIFWHLNTADLATASRTRRIFTHIAHQLRWTLSWTIFFPWLTRRFLCTLLHKFILYRQAQEFCRKMILQKLNILPTTCHCATSRTCLSTDIYTGHACHSSRAQHDAHNCRFKSINMSQRCLYDWEIYENHTEHSYEVVRHFFVVLFLARNRRSTYFDSQWTAC